MGVEGLGTEGEGSDNVRFLTLHVIYILTIDQMKRLLKVRRLFRLLLHYHGLNLHGHDQPDAEG